MEELLARLKLRLRFSGTTEDSVLQDHLLTAIDTVNDIRQYTPGDGDPVVEAKYKSVTVEMALNSYLKMGAEGQTVHDENGVNREYEAGMYPPSLLKLIVPRPRGLTS